MLRQLISPTDCDATRRGDMVTPMDGGTDSDLIASITPNVMTCLRRSLFFERLMTSCVPKEDLHEREVCAANYRISKRALEASGFDSGDFQDIFNVLRAQGACCDCEVLYNVSESSRLKAEYWKSRADRTETKPKHPPHGSMRVMAILQQLSPGRESQE
jgi:hypothetical protein